MWKSPPWSLQPQPPLVSLIELCRCLNSPDSAHSQFLLRLYPAMSFSLYSTYLLHLVNSGSRLNPSSIIASGWPSTTCTLHRCTGCPFSAPLPTVHSGDLFASQSFFPSGSRTSQEQIQVPPWWHLGWRLVQADLSKHSWNVCTWNANWGPAGQTQPMVMVYLASMISFIASMFKNQESSSKNRQFGDLLRSWNTWK